MKKLLLNIFSLAICLNAIAQIPTNGLMGYYNFNNSNIRDTSNNERHTYGGFTFGADRNGNSNSAYAGGRCGIQMPTPNGGGLTISCWVNFASYANQTTDYPMIASTGVYIYDNVGNQIGFLAKYLVYGQKTSNDSFTPRLDLYTGANGLNAIGVGTDCGKQLKAGIWYHITATHNNTDSSVKWYVNGQFINQQKLLDKIYLYNGLARTEDNYDVIGDLIIGGSSRGVFNGSNRLVQGSIYAHHSFGGSIDEFLIYDRGFSAQECLNLYNHFTNNTSVNNLNKFGNITLFPNPTNNVITLNNLTINSTIRILNNVGVKVKEIQALCSSETIDVSELSTGIYFVKCGNETMKLIKN